MKKPEQKDFYLHGGFADNVNWERFFKADRDYWQWRANELEQALKFAMRYESECGSFPAWFDRAREALKLIEESPR